MAEDMVERVAQAMAANNAAEEMFARGDNKGGWETLARVAIEAMREPTREVVRAVAFRAWHSGSGIDPETVWQAGIDAALNQKGVEG